MSRTLTEFYNEANLDLADKTNGTVETDDIKRYLNRAIVRRQSQEDFLTVKDRASFSAFDTVYEYPLPTGFKRLIDVYDNNKTVESDRVSPDQFWDKKNEKSDIIITSIDGIRGTRTLLFKDIHEDAVEIHGLTDITGNGTWVASSDANSLFEDESNYVNGNASLRFTITPSANTAVLTNSSFEAVDLSDSEDLSTLFLEIYLPATPTNLTSVSLAWGDDASNCWNCTATTQFSGAAFQVGWNTVAFPWASATQVGSPSASDVNYGVITLTHAYTSTTAGFAVNWLRSADPHPYRIHFYSTLAVKTNAGTYQVTFTADDDETVWDDDFDDIILKDAEVDVFNYVMNEPKKAEIARAEAEVMLNRTLSREPSDEKFIQSEYGSA